MNEHKNQHKARGAEGLEANHEREGINIGKQISEQEKRGEREGDEQRHALGAIEAIGGSGGNKTEGEGK